MSIHPRRGVTTTGVVLATAGLVALVVAVHAQQSPPRPPAAVAAPTATPSTSAAVSPARTPTPAADATHGPVLPAASPTTLDIPAIGVRSVVHPLGVNADQTVQVPPLSEDSWAGWYRYSPSPGQVGPAILLGHVDSAKYGPGVFYKLGALRPGDTVSVGRSDHTVAVFRVNRVAEFGKDHFPVLDVYGNTDRAALRLITCGGKFDLSAHSYEDNIVAFATLVSSHAG